MSENADTNSITKCDFAHPEIKRWRVCGGCHQTTNFPLPVPPKWDAIVLFGSVWLCVCMRKRHCDEHHCNWQKHISHTMPWFTQSIVHLHTREGWEKELIRKMKHECASKSAEPVFVKLLMLHLVGTVSVIRETALALHEPKHHYRMEGMDLILLGFTHSLHLLVIH